MQEPNHNPAKVQTSRTKAKRPLKVSKKKLFALIFAVLFLVVSISQFERLLSQGTIFGYKVMDTKSKSSSARKNKSGSVVGGQVSKDNQKSIACDKFPED